MKKSAFLPIFIILLIATILPNVFGLFASGNGDIYSGVVFNPIDGYSYLAKIMIGRSGEWFFTLPYSANPGEGRLLYPFYILLGQICGLLGLNVAIGFNIIRITAYMTLVFVLAVFIGKIDQNGKINSGLSLFLLAASGGLGWLLLPFGKFGVDFWVAEAFPFLSGLANPHFPIALAMMVLAIILPEYSGGKPIIVWMGLTGFLLSIVSPFGFVLICGVLFFSFIWKIHDHSRITKLSIFAFFVTGLPYSLYQYWAVTSTPQLAQWTAQNLTPSPQVWDIFLTVSPWLFLIAVGSKSIIGRISEPIVRRLVLWLSFGLILAFIPFDLQRRFLIGLSLPIIGLGLISLPEAGNALRMSSSKLIKIVTILVVPTTIILLIMINFSIIYKNTLYFFKQDELRAINYIVAHGNGRDLVIAGEENGLKIPALSRLRVLYGHQFESIDANNQQAKLASFISGNMGHEKELEFLRNEFADWIYFGPAEKKLGVPKTIDMVEPLAIFGEVEIFDARDMSK